MFLIWWVCLDLGGIQVLPPVMRASIEIRPCVLSRFRRLPGQKANGASPMIGLTRSKTRVALMCPGIRQGQHTILPARCSLSNLAPPPPPQTATSRSASPIRPTSTPFSCKHDHHLNPPPPRHSVPPLPTQHTHH